MFAVASAAECEASGATADRSLLQIRRAATEDKVAGVKSQLSKMQSLAQEVASGDRPLTDDEKGVVGKLQESVVKPVLTDTQAEHENAEKGLGDIKDTLDGCDATLHEKRVAVNAQMDAIEKRRAALATCRGIEASLLQANTTAGDKLSGFLSDSAAATPSCTSANSLDDVTALLAANKEWYAQHDADYQNLRGAAQAASAAYQTKLAECNKQQADMEEAECDWKVAVEAAQTEYDGCRKSTLADYKEALSAAEHSAVSRKHIWSAIKHLECYLNVLTTDQENMKPMLKECQGQKPNVDHLTIVEPELAPVNSDEIAALGDPASVTHCDA